MVYNNGEKMINFADFNVKLMIAYVLMMVVGLLIYIAFFKKDSSRRK